MLKYVEEFQKYVAIAGFRNVEVTDAKRFLKLINEGKQPDIQVQLFDAECVATWQHLYYAVLNALTAFKNGVNISKTLAMETMVYASAQGQIRKVADLVGIRCGSVEIAIVAIGERYELLESALQRIPRLINAKRDDTALELTGEKISNIRRLFQISDVELETIMNRRSLKEAIVDLIIERMALLQIER